MFQMLEVGLSMKPLIFWNITWRFYFNTPRENQLKLHSIKQTPKFSSVFFTGLTQVFPHFLRKTATILFLLNVKNNDLSALQMQKLLQIKNFDFHQYNIFFNYENWKFDMNFGESVKFIYRQKKPNVVPLKFKIF